MSGEGILRPEFWLPESVRRSAERTLARGDALAIERLVSAGVLLVGGHAEVVLPHAPRLTELLNGARPDLGIARWTASVHELERRLELSPPEDGRVREPESGRAAGPRSLSELSVEVLTERHRIELVLRVAERFAPEISLLVEAGEELLLEGDSVLHAHLFRLTPENEFRRAETALVAPEYRPAFWWFTKGVDVPPETVWHLGATSQLLAAFPEARAELEALAGAEQLLHPRSAPPVWDASPVPSAEAAAPPSLRGPSRRWLMAAVATFGAAVTVGGFLFSFTASQKASSERETEVLMQQLQALQDEKDATVRRAEERLKNAAVMSAAERAALEAELAEAKRAAESQAAAAAASGRQPPAGVRTTKPPRASGRPACDPGDPMCGGL